MKRAAIIGVALALLVSLALSRAADAPGMGGEPNGTPEPAQRERANPTAPPAAEDPPAALRRQIAAVLQRTHTPGAGVALIRRDGESWADGIGLADVAAGRPVTRDTLFRIASISKGFVALSQLKLQEEGKLSLQDTLKSRAPELDFVNPWEQTDPVRLVHLVEHTAGWDDNGIREQAFNPAREATLAEGLALRPKSRLSRWKPGTRFAYSNVGPAAAAYVIEKVTGQCFEDYVEANWFRPLQMTTASYVETPDVDRQFTKLYRADGSTVPYWKDFVRPSGALNASTREMANYLQFYVNRGSFCGAPLLTTASIDRMEQVTTTDGAREGLAIGYGVGNYTTVRNGWVYHGHTGGIEGALTEMGYLPEAGGGYLVMINSGRSDALAEISRLLRDRLTRDLPKPALPPVARVSPAIARQYTGWYELVSPRYETIHFITHLTAISKVKFGDTELIQQFYPSKRVTWLAVNDRFFRREDDPVPTLALIADHTDGTLIQTAGGISGVTLRRVPGWQVALQLGAGTLTAVLMLTTLGFAAIWLPRKIAGRMRNVEGLSVRAAPLGSTLSLIGIGWLMLPQSAEAVDRLGSISLSSLALFGATVMLPICAAGGMVQAWRHRHAPLHRLIWWHSLITSGMMGVAAAYLAYWGIIGLRTWV